MQGIESCMINRLFLHTWWYKGRALQSHAISHGSYLLLYLAYGFLDLTELKKRTQ